MKIKQNKGIVAMDSIIAIMAIMIFSGLIISLMHNNAVENLKIKMDTLASIYLTETFENIGIASYEEITQENIEDLIPSTLKEHTYNMDMTITEDENEKITKKIIATISYELGDKKYEYSMERIKIKE